MVKPDNSYDAKFFNKIASGLALDTQFNELITLRHGLKVAKLCPIIVKCFVNGITSIRVTTRISVIDCNRD